MQKQDIVNNKQPGLLWKTRCYLIGAMEFDDSGSQWRDSFRKGVEEMGVFCYDPYHKPFINDVAEDDNARKELKKWMENGEYDRVRDHMRIVRAHDLAMVDKSDFIVFNFNRDVMTIGSWEEFFWANRLKKPIFMASKGGISCAGLWTMGTIPYKYIYDSIDGVIDMLKKIDTGQVKVDSDRWRLLDYKYR